MAESLCLYEKRDPHIGIITMNRPEKKNAMSGGLYAAMDEAWHQAASDDDVWTVILTANGDSWCAGGDLSENIASARGQFQGPRFEGKHFPGRGYGNIRALGMNKPVIAAINGYAIGGGFGMALNCDIRYCVPTAKFGCSEVRWSHMAAWPSYLLTLPTGWGMWFALTGQMVDAETAFRIGLVQKVCEPDKLLDDAIELCTTINANGRLIAQFTKEYTDTLFHEIDGWEEAGKLHGQYYSRLRQSKNYDEGTASFVEKRKPSYSDTMYTDQDRPSGVPAPRQSS